MTQKKTFLLVGILVVILAAVGWWLVAREDSDQAARDKERYASLMTSTETLITNQKYDEAEKQLKEYLQGYVPKQYERGAAVRLATVYSNAKKYDQAIEWYKKAETTDGTVKADVAVGLAYTYEANGDKTGAIKYFKEAIKLAEKSNDPMADADKRSYEYEVKRLEGEQ